MIARKIVGVLAAATLAASGPAAAQSAAQSLSVTNSPSVRAGATLDKKSDLRRGGIVPIIAGVAIILAILALTDTWPFDDNDDGPDSP